MNEWFPALGRTFLSLAILGLGVGGFILMGTPEVPTQDPTPDPLPLVATKPAVAHTDGIDFDVDGVVVPYRQIQIAAQVAGKVEFKSDACRSGRTVRKGDLLLRIEPDDYELEVRRLKEELAQAGAMVLELDAEIKSWENQIDSLGKQLVIDARQLKRNQELMRRKAASSSEVDSARRAEIATENALQSLIDQKNLLTQRRIRMESAKALVQANLEKADLNLNRTEIRSPIDGVVVSESVEQDGYVQSGGSMMVLQDTSQLDVTCKLYMHQMHWLWQSDATDDPGNALTGGYNFPKTPATVIYDLSGQDYAWDAVADRYDGAGIDSQTRMVPIRIHVDDPTSVMNLADMIDTQRSKQTAAAKAFVATESSAGTSTESTTPPGNIPVDEPKKEPTETLGTEIAKTRKNLHPPTLMTGMFVKVRLHANPPIPLVRLPQEAIQPGNTVWIVQGGKLHKKSISIATSNPNYVVAYQVSGGLQAGDLVVTSPLASPVDGMQVQTADQAADQSKQDRAKTKGGEGPPASRQRPGTGAGR